MQYMPPMNAYIAFIPGFPYFEQKVPYIGVLYINSSVDYYIINSSGNGISGVQHYSVDKNSNSTTTGFTLLSALSRSSVQSMTTSNDPLQYYYGFSNFGMTSTQDEANTEYVLVVSSGQVSAENTELQYSISGGSWVDNPVTDASFDFGMANLTGIAKGMISDLMNTFRDVLSRLGKYISLPNFDPLQQIHLFESKIPAVGLGNYVLFRGKTNVDGVSYFSEEGMYYITNSKGPRTLFVDPHPFEWLLSTNIAGLMNSFLQLSEKFAAQLGIFGTLENFSLLTNDSSLVPFEYLESIGDSYNMTIVWPDDYTYRLLATSSPSVIVLDNLFLGLGGGPSLLNWDLGDISAGNQNLETCIMGYVENHTETGLIVTDGTISDLQYWLDSSTKLPIFSTDNIGASLSDTDVLNSSVLSSFLGFPLLPFYEYLKNLTASALGDSPTAEAIGSAPLLLPEVAWNGSLHIANSTIFGNLPSNLSIVYSNPYQELGWNATSEIGWQLAIPDSSFKGMISDLYDRGINSLYSDISEFITEVLSEASLTNPKIGQSFIDNISLLDNESISSYLKSFYSSITEINLTTSGAIVRILNETLRNIVLPSSLLSQIPVKIFALSPNGESGIVGYDKNFVQNGYRSVYVSFDMFDQNSDIMPKMFSDLANWTTSWKYEPLHDYGGLLINSSMLSSFENLASIGTEITLSSTFIPMNGTFNFSASLETGEYNLVFLSPYANITTLVGEARHSLQAGVNEINFTWDSNEIFNLSLRADPQLEISPVIVDLQKIQNYTVDFNESGLPVNREWYVNVSGQNSSGPITSSSFSMSLSNGSYDFTVGTGNGLYYSYLRNGSFTVSGANLTENIQFFYAPYAATFSETGLPTGTEWYVTITGSASQPAQAYGQHDTANVSFRLPLPNGTYSFIIGTMNENYTPIHSGGSFTISNSSVSIAISFLPLLHNVTIKESGLPSGAKWYVNLTNGQTFSSSSSAIFFSETNGSYFFTIATIDKEYEPSVYLSSFTVNGTSVLVQVSFSQLLYNVTFLESGLGSGSDWYVSLNGTVKNSTSNEITFKEPNGTYSFHVLPPTGANASPLSGNISVDGSNVSQTVHFSTSVLKVYSVTFYQTGLPEGINWSVTFNGTTNTSVPSISFSVPNGTYSYSVASKPGYNDTPPSGSVTVNGHNVSLQVTFVRNNDGYFVPTVIPENASLYVDGILYQRAGILIGLPAGNSNGSVEEFFNISLPPGTYQVKITAPGYRNYTTTITIASPLTSLHPDYNLERISKPSSSLLPEAAIIAVAIVVVAAIGATVIFRKRRI